MISLIFTLKKSFVKSFSLEKNVYSSTNRVHSTQEKPRKSGRGKKLGRICKTQGYFLENQSTQWKHRENFYTFFRLDDTITMFGS